MAQKIITKGDVKNLELQPDWTIESDGYGLLTSRLTYRCAAADAKSKAPQSGEVHPKDGRLKCHRSTYTIIKGEFAQIVSEYVGIETADTTKIQIRGEITTGTQPIQAHKDFLKRLKDLGWSTQSQSFPETSAKAIQSAMVGIRSFISADSQITATFYTSSRSEVTNGVNMVGKTFARMAGMEDVILPTGGQGISTFHDRYAMLTGLSYEKYAHLYKINFTIRLSPGGYHSYVYTKHN